MPSTIHPTGRSNKDTQTPRRSTDNRPCGASTVEQFTVEFPPTSAPSYYQHIDRPPVDRILAVTAAGSSGLASGGVGLGSSSFVGVGRGGGRGGASRGAGPSSSRGAGPRGSGRGMYPNNFSAKGDSGKGQGGKGGKGGGRAGGRQAKEMSIAYGKSFTVCLNSRKLPTPLTHPSVVVTTSIVL